MMSIFYSIKNNAFYDDRISVSLPPDAVEITETERSQMLSTLNSGGMVEIVGARVKCIAAPTPSLEESTTYLQLQIDQSAEAERLKYITGGVGQAMIYQEKVAQAIDYSKAYAEYKTNPKANAEPNDNAYPLLSAGIGTRRCYTIRGR